MDLNKENMLATINMKKLQEDNVTYMNEQDVNNVFETKRYSQRFTGNFINENNIHEREPKVNGNSIYKKPRSVTGLIMFIIGLFIVAVVAYRCSAVWLQEKLNLKY